MDHNIKKLYSHAATIIPVVDLQKTLDFYEQKLDFETTFKWGDPLEYVVGKLGDNISIHFTKNENSERHEAALYVFVHDVDKLYSSLLNHGVRISNDIGDRDYGMRDFDVLDSNEFRLTFGMSLERVHP